MKYNDEKELYKDYWNNKITYDEFMEHFCEFKVLEHGYDPDEYFDNWWFAEHDLYILLTNDEAIIVENFY